jgi:hypothetical protein
MNIIDRINPVKVYKNLFNSLVDLSHYYRYKKIITELNNEGKLESIGLKPDENGNLYLGVDLNPELLLYTETSQESVELKLISEKMKKYTDFLTKEGILDSIKVEYERILTEEYYGYVLQISFDFKKYKRAHIVYAIGYTLSAFALIALGIFSLVGA